MTALVQLKYSAVLAELLELAIVVTYAADEPGTWMTSAVTLATTVAATRARTQNLTCSRHRGRRRAGRGSAGTGLLAGSGGSGER